MQSTGQATNVYKGLHIGTLCIFILCCALLKTACAQIEDGEEHYLLGLQHAAARNHAAALREFEAAYRVNPLSVFALDIGLLHLKLGHAGPAQTFCGLYLRAEKIPAAPAHGRAAACVDSAVALLRSQRAAAAQLRGRTPSFARAASSAKPVPVETEPDPDPLPPALVHEPADAQDAPEPPAQPAPPAPKALRLPSVIPLTPLRAASASLLFAQTLKKLRPPVLRPVYKTLWFWSVLSVATAGIAMSIVVILRDQTPPVPVRDAAMPGPALALRF